MNDDTREKLLAEEGRGGKRNIMTAKVHFCREKSAPTKGCTKKDGIMGLCFTFLTLKIKARRWCLFREEFAYLEVRTTAPFFEIERSFVYA